MQLKGYIFSREFFGERVPQHAQNIIIKDYCAKKNYNFLLSATEYKSKESTYILLELINNFSQYDGIVLYSLLQLPKSTLIRHSILKQTLKKNKELHFALENLKFRSKKDFERIEKIFLLKSSLSKKIFTKGKGKYLKLITSNHEKTKRNYLGRMLNNKVNCMKISKKYNRDYWDGDRKYGYGGYKYINNRWTNVAKKLIKNYHLDNKSSILDLGCGKAFLLYEIKKILPKIKINGCDFSKYAIQNSKKEIRKNIFFHDIRKKLPFKNNTFDLVISINVLHNLKIGQIFNCLKEINRISKKSFICVESYKNEKEQFNLQCWALTAETLIDTRSWKWIFDISNYNGDFEFIYFK